MGRDHHTWNSYIFKTSAHLLKMPSLPHKQRTEISSTNCTFKRLQSSKATPRSILLEAAGYKAEITALFVYTVYSLDGAQYQQGRCGDDTYGNDEILTEGKRYNSLGSIRQQQIPKVRLSGSKNIFTNVISWLTSINFNKPQLHQWPLAEGW